MVVCPICEKEEGSFCMVCPECLEQLQAENEELKTICRSGTTFEDMRLENVRLQAENEQREGVIESLQWDIDNYLKGTLEAQLKAENKQLREALKTVCSRCQRLETVQQATKGAAKDGKKV